MEEKVEKKRGRGGEGEDQIQQRTKTPASVLTLNYLGTKSPSSSSLLLFLLLSSSRAYLDSVQHFVRRRPPRAEKRSLAGVAGTAPSMRMTWGRLSTSAVVGRASGLLAVEKDEGVRKGEGGNMMYCRVGKKG